MAAPFNPIPPLPSIAAPAPVSIYRLAAVAAPHIAGLVIMWRTETDLSSRVALLFARGILNIGWIAVFRRPALSAALSLTMVMVLILLSRLKHDVLQMTANFIDLMVIDRDTFAFLMTIFPDLRTSTVIAAIVIIPLMIALWRLDPFRIRRLPALAAMLACLAGLTAHALAWPDEAWRGYYDDGYLSKFSRSGVTAMSDLLNHGFL